MNIEERIDNLLNEYKLKRNEPYKSNHPTGAWIDDLIKRGFAYAKETNKTDPKKYMPYVEGLAKSLYHMHSGVEGYERAIAWVAEVIAANLRKPTTGGS